MINSIDTITVYKRINHQNIEYIFREAGFPHCLIVNVRSEFLNSRLKVKYFIDK